MVLIGRRLQWHGAMSCVMRLLGDHSFERLCCPKDSVESERGRLWDAGMLALRLLGNASHDMEFRGALACLHLQRLERPPIRPHREDLVGGRLP